MFGGFIIACRVAGLTPLVVGCVGQVHGDRGQPDWSRSRGWGANELRHNAHRIDQESGGSVLKKSQRSQLMCFRCGRWAGCEGSDQDADAWERSVRCTELYPRRERAVAYHCFVGPLLTEIVVGRHLLQDSL